MGMVVIVAIDPHQLFHENLGLVGYVARCLWQRPSVRRIGTRDDVEQIGSIGLLNATNTWREHGRFSTFACECIKNEILQAARGESRRWPDMRQLPDMEADENEPEHERVEDTALLRTLLARLSKSEKVVLQHRYCLLGLQKRKIPELAKRLKVCERRVLAIQACALNKLRGWIKDEEKLQKWLKGWME